MTVPSDVRPSDAEEHPDRARTELPDTERSDTEQPDTEQTDTEQPDNEQPDSEQPDSERPAGPAVPTTGPSGKRAGRLVARVLVVLLVISAVAVGALAWQAVNAARVQSAQDAALDAARTEVAQVLTYSPQTLDADLAAARKVVSGGFAAHYEELANTLLIPAVHQHNLSSKATVTQAAVLEAQPDQVRALVFVSQATSIPGQQAPRTVSSQLRVTMTRNDGRWLISDLQTL